MAPPSPPVAKSVKPDSRDAALHQPPSDKIREEGELSSSTDDEEELSNPAGAAPDKGAAVISGSEIIAAKPLSPISSVDAISIQAQSSLLPDSRISSESILVPFRSSTTKWDAKSGHNNDLVIVFSDGESGSDSECKQNKTTEVKGAISCLENRKPVPSSYPNVRLSQKAKIDKAKPLPNRGVSTRTFKFTPSNTKPFGSKLKYSAEPQVKPRFVRTKDTAFDQNVTNQSCKPREGKCLETGELQDLRQKIAIRETEIKLKTSRQIREAMAGSSSRYDPSTANINIQKRDRARAMPSEYVRPDVSEPDKKRLKNDSSGQRKQFVTVELAEQCGLVSNPSRGQPDISCGQKSQTLVNQHSETVLGVIDSDCQKELDSLGYDVRPGYNINSSELGNQIMESLFVEEEMHDRELEKAQKDRRHCEIEERIARNTYCEAQSALIEAMSRCNSLYRQREQSSTQMLSLLIGDVRSRVSAKMDQVENATRVNTAEDKSLQVLLKLDDSLEKKLEETQELRHKCEIDERNSLKAYRRTQFALIEASDRCSYLYRKKQLLATRANIEFFSRCCNQFESSPGDDLNTKSRVHLDAIQSPQHVRMGHADANQMGYDSNFHSTSKDTVMVGNNLDSETHYEPDSSSSEPLLQSDSNADHMLCSSNSNTVLFVDQDEQTLLSSDGPCPPDSRCVKQSWRVETKNALHDSTHTSSIANSDQVFLLQEAKLRSELHARLGRRPLSQKVDSDIKKSQHSVDNGAENDINSEKPELYGCSLPLPQDEKVLPSSHGVDPDEDQNLRLSFRGFACSPDSVLRSTFSCIKKLNSAVCQSGMLQAKNLECISNNTSNFNGSDNSSEKTLSNALENNPVLSVKDIFSKQYESYSCNMEADLFWPFCMYELRGKCNDESCHWQHIKARLNQNTNHLGSIASSSCQQFPVSRAASRFLQRKMLNIELSGLVGSQRFQATESNRKLSYLRSQSTLAQLGNTIPDVESSLETALIILDQEIDTFEGTNEALLLLSRAIEVDPNSSAVWVIYLLAFYSSKRADEKDDMFLCAVKNNARSYELWLLYINSRLEFSSRLVAYDKAISALCSESSAPHSESDTGSLILDIYLQMMDFLCMSGQVEKATEKVIELTHSASTSDKSHPLLSRFYSSLSVPDKCILWVSCLYLGVYRRLPEAVVQQFELKKELIELYWPAVELKYDEMLYAKKIMIAVEQLADLCINIDAVPHESFTGLNLKSRHLFAVNHFRCKVTLDGIKSGKSLLEKYIKLYPTCREFVHLMVQMYGYDFQELSVVGFEEALRNWPKELLGVHYIWNQYVAHALEKQRFDIASEVLCRWYESVYKCQPAKCQLSEDECCVAQIQDNPSDSLSSDDKLFEWLNLALYHILRSEQQEAKAAVNKALEIAPADLFKHCVREHASFHRIGVQSTDDTSIYGIVEFLNGYMVDNRVSIAPCILSRTFISYIKKPRVQQLVKKFLVEVSPDCSILNSALEAWFGPSLLPQNYTETKQLVNFVEVVMEIVPTNHQFAFSVFRHVSKDLNNKDVGTSSLLFWASNLLVNSISEAVPVAPEFVWAEAAALLGSLTSIQDVSEKFHERAVSVYPFSKRLWKSLARIKFNSKTIIERSREKGIQLELPQTTVD